MRGCNCGGGGIACTSDEECLGGHCIRGGCRDEAFYQADKTCHDGVDCKDRGFCGADFVKSFLGANRELECVALSDADCRASKACSDAGLCAYFSSACVAKSDEDCRTSKRCETHDECAHAADKCVRSDGTCDKLAAWDRPAWGSIGLPIEDDISSLGSAPKADAIDGDTLVCTVSEPGEFDSLEAKVANFCSVSIVWNKDVRSKTFVLPGVKMRLGDSVSASLVDHELIGPDPPAYTKAKLVTGKPLKGTVDGAEILCRVVSRVDAEMRVNADLEAADKELARAKKEKPGPDTIGNGPSSSTSIERRVSNAASWIGWDHPEVKARVAGIEALVREWSRALGELLEKTRATASAPHVLVDDGGGVAFEVAGIVCGDRLRERYKATHPQAEPPDLDCAAAVVMKNGTLGAIHLDAVVSLHLQLRWLRRTVDGAAFEYPAVVDVSQGRSGAPALDIDVAPGDEATLLLVGSTPLALGKGQPDEGALLQTGALGKPRKHLKTDVER
jgi:hypothetical protein